MIGSPVQNYSEFMKSFVVFRKLPELKSKVDKIEKDLTKK
jgi:Rps23 Pro-64 3,4-dihydroxylase Tpa1-like proline 4-hydroxylase